MIHLKDGIHVKSKGKKYVLDSRNSQGDVNFVSHAHSDHSPQKDCKTVCSDLTHKILGERFSSKIENTEKQGVELFPSGHIVGSSAALIEDKILYTGDVSTRDRCYLDGFKPVKADKLIIETTYGLQNYKFPDQKELEKEIKDWIRDSDKPLFLFAYSLGKAQKIQHLVQEATKKPIVAHKSVIEMNKVIQENTELRFRAEHYKNNREVLEEKGVFIVPSHCSRADYIQKMSEKYGCLKAGFSGWAVNSSYRYRGGYDKTFPFSDHCDFEELVELVENVDPEKVYTNHGFDEAFASYLRREKGFNARALKNNQSSLTDF